MPGRANLKTLVGLLVCLHVLWGPANAHAQDEPRPPAHHLNRLYFGMWTAHLKRHPTRLDNNWVIGASYHGYFGATFLNSFGRRAYAGGIQRRILSREHEPLGFTFGYRLGFISGYDGRLMALARHTPVLPLVQPWASFEVGHAAIEVSYTFVVISVMTSYKF